MPRRPIERNYSESPDVSTEVAYAICRNIYATKLDDPSTFICLCQKRGRGQTCAQMNIAALDVVQTIVKFMGEKK